MKQRNSMDITKIKYKIADRFLETLSKKVFPWKLKKPINVITKNKYNGINFLNLACVAFLNGYKSNLWATYDQWHSIEMQVEKRPAKAKSWSSDVLVWENQRYKKHAVFNTDQVFGKDLTKHLNHKEILKEDYSLLDSILLNSKVEIEEVESLTNEAYFSYKDNKIRISSKDFFNKKRQYYSTVFHELSHWSESKLNWIGEESQNELIAEMAVGFIEAELNLEKCLDETNSLYWLEDWKKNIESNPDYLFEAASQANKVANFIMSFSDLQSQDK